MIRHSAISNQVLRTRIRNGTISLGGNRQLKIYGQLNCRTGKRMKKENRVFFPSEAAAMEQGYRPCAHCMNNAYQNWKKGMAR